MAWTTPRTWVTGEVLSSANLNTHIRDNFNYLKGQAGDITIDANEIIATQYAMRSPYGGGGVGGYIQGGSFTLNGAAGGTVGQGVGFAVAFSSVIAVHLTWITSAPSANFTFGVTSLATTGFTAWAAAGGGTFSADFYYLAIGAK